MSKTRIREIRLFERSAGISFRDKGLLNTAFSHCSYSNEKSTGNNERLEFLGDSVLGLIVTEYLYRTYFNNNEGYLAKIKAFVVSEESLSRIAKKLRVDNFILIGKGEEYSGGRNKKAILADCIEAIFGAYYLDSGFKPVKEFILKNLIPEIASVVADKHKKDYKTLLQEMVQKSKKIYPRYVVTKKTGPDHNQTFFIEVRINNIPSGNGIGKNKKEAEQKAAEIAYKTIIKKKEPEK